MLKSLGDAERLEAALLDVLGENRWSHFGVESLRNAFSRTESGVITTNYDLLPDLAIQPLLSSQESIDYGIMWRGYGHGCIAPAANQSPGKPIEA